MRILSTTIFFFLVSILNAQLNSPFNIEVEASTFDAAPGVHSFAWGMNDQGEWLIIGGRIDGLHQRQPFASFLAQDNNKFAYVINPESKEVWSTSLSVLNASLFEQLQSTNAEFYQRDNFLYIIGGYGFSPTEGDHITFPNLTAIDVSSTISSIKNGQAIDSFFRQITDERFAVTGGQLGYLDSIFYLAGGQDFEGRYNPHGPTHGPGFIQNYTDEIRRFKILDDGTNLSITNYETWNDTDNLHRRDYNMAPQTFPDGTRGFTMFSGVFQKAEDLPFLNTVDVNPSGYQVKSGFNQYLSQYHSAKIPVFDVNQNIMHTLFLGGMSQYTLDNQGNLVEDKNVPFVNTISRVTRFDDGSMQEASFGTTMPALTGSGAEFIPLKNWKFFEDEILQLHLIPQEKTLVGYVFGGIESTAPNIFFINTGTQSHASNLLYKVYITQNTTGLENTELNPEQVFNLTVFPNPVEENMTVQFYNPNPSDVKISLRDSAGKLNLTIVEKRMSSGLQEINVGLPPLSEGIYFVELTNGVYTFSKAIQKR